MATALINRVTTVWNRTDERESRRKESSMAREIKLPVGDGNANVSVTRGFKTWFSTREGGLTVESTVNVSVKCHQSERDIRAAIENASVIAESEAIAGSEEMGLHIDAFAKETGGR